MMNCKLTKVFVSAIAIAASAFIPLFADETPTLDVTDDATALKVTVPAGCLEGMKLELAYDNSTAASSMFLRADLGVARDAWAYAYTLSESVPAEGAEFTIPFSDLGVPADACFRLFATTADYALLDYVDQNDANSDHDTGIPDNQCCALELSQYSKPWSGTKYSSALASLWPSATQPGFGLIHAGSAAKCYFMQRVNGQYTYSNVLTLNTAVPNVWKFRNNAVVLNGTTQAATTGAKKWATPLGESGENIHMGRFANETELKVQSRWYYLRLFGQDGSPLLDYVPVSRKSDNVGGFLDKTTGRFVTPSGGGAFDAGTVTNDTDAIVCAIGGLRSFPRLAKKPATVTLDTTDGAKLTVKVNPGYGIGSKLLLAYGTGNGGEDVASWSNSLELCESIPEEGGTYTVDLAERGLDTGHMFRVFIANRYTMLKRVQLDSDDDTIDTGIRDYLSHGCDFGYYCTGYSNKYSAFLGSGIGSNASNCGFRFCLGGSATYVMLGQFTNGKYTYKFFNLTANVRNEIEALDGAVRCNGVALNPQTGNSTWCTDPLGVSALNIFVGRLSTDNTSGNGNYGWWYHLTIYGADGNPLLDYVPVKRSDGVAGFLDRVSAKFVTPTAGGSLVAGDAESEEALVGMVVSDTMTCDPQLPITATWMGGASVDLANAVNWECFNYLGDVLPATTLPLVGVTEATFGGNLAFSVAAAEDRLWSKAKFIDSTLAGDCDWSGLGNIALDGTIELAGYSLVLSGVPSAGTITSSPSGDPAELRFAIPEGLVCENANCAITGNLRLFKSGAGTLVATKYPQTYSGGTDIESGTLKAGVPGSINTVDRGSFFGSLLTLDVRKDGTLDSGGTYGWGYHTINLHGGTLTSSVASPNNTYLFNPVIHLTDDSTVEVYTSSDTRSPLLDLGGHTLNINFHNGAWQIFTSLATNGNIVVTGDGVFNLEKNGAIDCSTCSFDISSKLNIDCGDLTMADLAVRCPEGYVTGGKLSSPIKVKGRFTPATRYFPSVQLQDGATLDISGYNVTWPTASLVANCALSFAEDASVTLALGERTLNIRQLVEWPEDTPPVGVDTLSVKCDRPRVSLEIRGDGIYNASGMVILVR
ncbi:MAG: hypothetical protein IJ146_08070 [Kiritimatiellae bacterium]|nr:hypothetical protein [Kiritimatiellia bacterium]